MYGRHTDGLEIYHIHQARYADRLREARAARLAAEAAAPAARRPLAAPALAWLGAQLVRWGESLQQAAGSRQTVQTVRHHPF